MLLKTPITIGNTIPPHATSRYSDWYKPRESWEQRAVNDDTLSETIDLLKLQVTCVKEVNER